MKIKNYLLHFIAALTTFIFGVIFFNALHNVSLVAQTNNLEAIAAQSVSQQEVVVMPSSVAEMHVVETVPAPDLNENIEYEFDADGDYYALDTLPKNFRDFGELSIKTYDYSKAAEENEYKGMPIPPEGFVFINKEFKFSRINIANRQIAFETEAKKGVSYKFVGRFVDNVQRNDEGSAELEGRLIKMQNGKKIAQTKIRLAAGGC